MREKVRKIRSKISSSENYPDELIEEIKNIPTYDLFTPERASLVCENLEIRDPERVYFIMEKNQKKMNTVVFLISLKEKNPKDIIPVKLYLRYEIEDSNLPHHPGKDYEFQVHNSEIIRDKSDLKSLLEEDIPDNYNLEDYPALKVRSEVKDEEPHKEISIL